MEVVSWQSEPRNSYPGGYVLSEGGGDGAAGLVRDQRSWVQNPAARFSETWEIRFVWERFAKISDLTGQCTLSDPRPGSIGNKPQQGSVEWPDEHDLVTPYRNRSAFRQGSKVAVDRDQHANGYRLLSIVDV